jgi:hypothetical protein
MIDAIDDGSPFDAELTVQEIVSALAQLVGMQRILRRA